MRYTTIIVYVFFHLKFVIATHFANGINKIIAIVYTTNICDAVQYPMRGLDDERSMHLIDRNRKDSL